MKQLDVPFVALNIAGHPALASLHAVLTNDLLTHYPYRTNAELGALVGVGPKRVVQYFEMLENYGLLKVESTGSRRLIAIDFLPNPCLVTDLLGQVPPASAGSSEAETDQLQQYFGRATLALINAKSAFPSLNFPKSEKVVSHGYVRTWASGIDLAFYYTNKGSTLYSTKDNNSTTTTAPLEVDHNTLVNVPGLAALAVKKPKAKVVKKTSDQIPQSSFSFRFWARERLPLDTEHFANVQTVLGAWNTTMGSEIPLIGETYRLIRQNLVENGFTTDQVIQAIGNFSRDPWWAPKKPGLAVLLGKPDRLAEFVDKTPGHDRFGRNLKHESVRDENGEVIDAYRF